MEIKPGTIAIMQITGEPVFVLGERKTAEPGPYLSGKEVYVRRAVQEGNLLSYITDTCCVEELESTEVAEAKAKARMSSRGMGRNEEESIEAILGLKN